MFYPVLNSDLRAYISSFTLSDGVQSYLNSLTLNESRVQCIRQFAAIERELRVLPVS